MMSQTHIFNTSPTCNTLNKAAQGGNRFSFGGINSADSNLDNKTPCLVRYSNIPFFPNKTGPQIYT